MLILIGAAPTAYALNRTVPVDSHTGFRRRARSRRRRCSLSATGSVFLPPDDAREQRDRRDPNCAISTIPPIYAASARWPARSARRCSTYGSLRKVPAAAVQNVRNDMFWSSEAIRLMQKA